MYELLAPSKYYAAIWAITYLVSVAGWCLVLSSRMGTLLDRIRTEDGALWKELDSPESWRDLGSSGQRPKLRRLKLDQSYALRFNHHVVEDILRLQRQITYSLVVMFLFGGFVIYLAWPYR